MDAKHTPGPWKVLTKSEAIHEFIVATEQSGLSIADCLCFVEEREANARLIAAAPDMLNALRRAVLALAFSAETSPAMRDDYNAVSAAIAKATGA